MAGTGTETPIWGIDVDLGHHSGIIAEAAEPAEEIVLYLQAEQPELGLELPAEPNITADDQPQPMDTFFNFSPQPESQERRPLVRHFWGSQRKRSR